MISAEGERVRFHKSFKIRGPPEKWLSEVEATMKKTIQTLIKTTKSEVYGQPPNEWIPQTPAQISACLSQLFWTLEVEEALQSNPNKP